MERLQKLIAKSGICSRRKSEEYILSGLVEVNGVVITELGSKFSENDIIKVNGEIITKEKKVYLLMNKPMHTVCTLKDNFARQIITDLIDIPERVYPVGRLDYDTTGAIILTNDGDLANLLTHPRNHIGKTYLVEVDKDISDDDLKSLEKGVEIDDYITSPAIVKKVNNRTFHLTIFEGKNHQVKNMLLELNYLVSKLHRLKIDKFGVNDLKYGQYRYLSVEEINYLKNKLK